MKYYCNWELENDENNKDELLKILCSYKFLNDGRICIRCKKCLLYIFSDKRFKIVLLKEYYNSYNIKEYTDYYVNQNCIKIDKYIKESLNEYLYYYEMMDQLISKRNKFESEFKEKILYGFKYHGINQYFKCTDKHTFFKDFKDFDGMFINNINYKMENDFLSMKYCFLILDKNIINVDDYEEILKQIFYYSTKTNRISYQIIMK